MNKNIIYNLEQLNNVIEKDEIAIYGAGRVARTFVKFLAQNRKTRPIHIWISERLDNPWDIMGIPVDVISKYSDEMSDKVLICCVMESLHDEVNEIIKEYSFKEVYYLGKEFYSDIIYALGDYEIENYYEIKRLQRECEENRRKLTKLVPKPGLECLIVNILDHCNLRCKGCDHFACVADEYVIPYERIRADITRMAELLEGNYIKKIAVMGGEPLLHPELLKILVDVRKNFPFATIRLTTNGILLLKQNEEFWKVCRENNIIIVNTKYPINLDYNAMIQKSAQEKVKYMYYEGTGDHFVKKSFKKNIDLTGQGDPVENWLKCGISNGCNFLMEGKIYPCPFACQSYRIFNKKFNENLQMTESDYLDIYQIQDKNEIFKFTATPKYYCRYCTKGVTERENWTRSKGEKSEWV